jgi:hypothetical protein
MKLFIIKKIPTFHKKLHLDTKKYDREEIEICKKKAINEILIKKVKPININFTSL